MFDPLYLMQHFYFCYLDFGEYTHEFLVSVKVFLKEKNRDPQQNVIKLQVIKGNFFCNRGRK